MSAAHTPTPWRVSRRTDAKPGSNVVADTSYGVVRVVEYVGDRATDLTRANAAHIVRCVNAHDELVAAVEGAVALLDAGAPSAHLWNYAVEHFRAALAKAGAA